MPGEGECFTAHLRSMKRFNYQCRKSTRKKAFPVAGMTYQRKQSHRKKHIALPNRNTCVDFLPVEPFATKPSRFYDLPGLRCFQMHRWRRHHLIKHPGHSLNHTIVDMGDDFFMQGKPHPMINGLERKKRILQEVKDPQMAPFTTTSSWGTTRPWTPSVKHSMPSNAKRIAGENGIL